MTEISALRQYEIRRVFLQKSNRNIIGGVVVAQIVALGIAAMLWPVVSHQRILIWLPLLLVAYLLMLWFQIQYTRVEGSPNLDLSKWQFQRIIALSLMGAMWGCLSIFLWPIGLPAYQLALPMVIVAVSCGMMVAYPGVRSGYVIHAFLAIGPVIGRMLMEGTRPHYWAAFLALVLMQILFWLGNNLRKRITKSVIVGIENRELAEELQGALDKIKSLSGMLPICANCKKIRDDQGYYQQIEHYITEHSEAEFTHGICPDCAKELYPDINFSGS